MKDDDFKTKMEGKEKDSRVKGKLDIEQNNERRGQNLEKKQSQVYLIENTSEWISLVSCISSRRESMRTRSLDTEGVQRMRARKVAEEKESWVEILKN
jgi:hypothetical protein